MGGEIQRGSLTHDTGYSTKAQCTGKQSYLEPNSGSLHVPIEGVYRITEKTEDRVTIEEKHNQNHAENAARTYLERIRNRMQKPIEGLFSLYVAALNKGGGYSHRGQQTLTPKQQTENFVDRFLCSA
jgi:membrane-bound lytic murein transglycosylase MltF